MVPHIAVKCLPTKTSLLPRWTETGATVSGVIRTIHIHWKPRGSKRMGVGGERFYVVTRRAYDAVGTHEAVKNQIIEDVKLGEKIKEQKLRLKMVRGEHHVKTVLAGDFATNWQGLRRSINLIPLSLHQHKINAFPLTAIATFFLLIGPYILVPFSILLSMPLTILSEKWGLGLLTINLIILVLM